MAFQHVPRAGAATTVLRHGSVMRDSLAVSALSGYVKLFIKAPHNGTEGHRVPSCSKQGVTAGVRRVFFVLKVLGWLQCVCGSVGRVSRQQVAGCSRLSCWHQAPVRVFLLVGTLRHCSGPCGAQVEPCQGLQPAITSLSQQDAPCFHMSCWACTISVSELHSVSKTEAASHGVANRQPP